MGLKSRVLLYQGDWANAAKAAKDVMDLNQYFLFPDYQGLFLEVNERAAGCEIMMRRCYTPKIDPSYLYYPLGEWPAFAPTKQLADSYYMNDGLPISKSPKYDAQNPHMNRDPRFAASLFYPGCQYLNFMIKAPDPEVSKDSIQIPSWLLNSTGYRSKKHFDGTLTNAEDEGRDTYFMRYAEILLNYAEALNESEGPVKAVYDAIDALRDRAHTTRLSTAMPNLSKDAMRIEIRRAEAIKSGTEVIGNRTRAKVVKNKVAPPFKVAEFDIMYGEGISKEGTLLDIAVNMDIIQKSGAWYSYKGNRISQGREAAKTYLKEHPDVAQEIDKIIRDTLVVEPDHFEDGVLSEQDEEN